MSVIYPNERVEKRWRGALSKRLRMAPLERLLTSLQLPLAAPGAAQLTDNLCSATVHLVEAALGGRGDPFVFSQLRESVAGPLACAISQGLADEIGEAAAWRIAAMIAIAVLLAPRCGYAAASQQAVATAYAYGASPLESIRAATRQVVHTRQPYGLVRLILRELTGIAARAPGRLESHTG